MKPQFLTLLAWCLHNDKAERGTSNQPDKAPVTKERSGWSPTQETLGIIRGGGVQSFRPTHLAEDPPTQTPPPLLQLNSYKRSLVLMPSSDGSKLHGPRVTHHCSSPVLGIHSLPIQVGGLGVSQSGTHPFTTDHRGKCQEFLLPPPHRVTTLGLPQACTQQFTKKHPGSPPPNRAVGARRMMGNLQYKPLRGMQDSHNLRQCNLCDVLSFFFCRVSQSIRIRED